MPVAERLLLDGSPCPIFRTLSSRLMTLEISTLFIRNILMMIMANPITARATNIIDNALDPC